MFGTNRTTTFKLVLALVTRGSHKEANEDNILSRFKTILLYKMTTSYTTLIFGTENHLI